MERAAENRRPVVAKPVPSVRAMGNRRPLREINNIVGAHPNPCAVAKKPMLEKNGRVEQKPALVSRRPVTRKFAASLGNREEPDRQATSAEPAPPGFDPKNEPITIDSDDDIESVDEIESVDDTDMDENELKDALEDESLMDIDSADWGNPLAATEYVEEMYKYYRENEVVRGKPIY